MLRQIHIYFNRERLFSYTLALAFDDNEINNIVYTFMESIQLSNIDIITSRRISEYLIFYKKLNNLIFLIVTDLIDPKEYIEKILENIVKKFHFFFPDIKLLNNLSNKQEFINYFISLQADLHSKISIIGPSNAGKSKLYDILTNKKQEKKVMNFAKISTFEIYDLSFDVWDFQLKDNFSLLWSKIISGSDLIIFLFSASNYNLNVLDYYLTLKKKESPLSKFIIIANKIDLVDENDKKRIITELNINNIFFLSLNDLNVKEKILKIISNDLKLKSSLPNEYNELLLEAENSIQQNNHVKALTKYKELLEIANKYQYFDQFEILKKKINDINQEISQKSDIRKKLERKMKFAPPKQITFTKEIKIKSLPKINNQVKNTPKSDLSQIRDDDLQTIHMKTQLGDIQETKDINNIFKKEYENFDDIPNKGLYLQKMIQNQGSSLSLELCNRFIAEMKNSLKRELTIDDLKTAVRLFLKRE
ncbi:MAG: hypothetical protein JXA99_10620 [Candidatus Lokiarchaeota archaeon]|nr:hypothetical protein [Candidatus Lokiarchaeota archaeon]